MTDFSQNINDFQRYGIYTYQFDNVGNLTFNSSSANFNQVFLAFPLMNIIYNQTKVATLYDSEFKEFVPTQISSSIVSPSSADLEQQLENARQENVDLQSRLDVLIAQNEATGSMAVQQAIKQVILELRQQLGQGRVESDFSEEFPYTPIIKPKA